MDGLPDMFRRRLSRWGAYIRVSRHVPDARLIVDRLRIDGQAQVVGFDEDLTVTAGWVLVARLQATLGGTVEGTHDSEPQVFV